MTSGLRLFLTGLILCSMIVFIGCSSENSVPKHKTDKSDPYSDPDYEVNPIGITLENSMEKKSTNEEFVPNSKLTAIFVNIEKSNPKDRTRYAEELIDYGRDALPDIENRLNSIEQAELQGFYREIISIIRAQKK